MVSAVWFCAVSQTMSAQTLRLRRTRRQAGALTPNTEDCAPPGPDPCREFEALSCRDCRSRCCLLPPRSAVTRKRTWLPLARPSTRRGRQSASLILRTRTGNLRLPPLSHLAGSQPRPAVEVAPPAGILMLAAARPPRRNRIPLTSALTIRAVPRRSSASATEQPRADGYERGGAVRSR